MAPCGATPGGCADIDPSIYPSIHPSIAPQKRPDIRLPDIQARLLRELASVNPRIVLVLLHGGMVGLDDVLDHVPAVVSAGYPGRYASTVLPEALLGIRDRGCWGKTTVTWYRNSFGDDFNMLDFDMSRPPGRTYRYHTGEPNFRFGHGLNPLTTFALSGLAVRPGGNCTTTTDEDAPPPGEGGGAGGRPAAGTTVAAVVVTRSCPEVVLSVTVENTGPRAADEVVLAYFRPLDIPRTEPAAKLREQLFGFERIHLRPLSPRAVVTFAVRADRSLELATGSGTPKTFPGRYALVVSNGSDRLETTVVVGGDGRFRVEEDHPTTTTEPGERVS